MYRQSSLRAHTTLISPERREAIIASKLAKMSTTLSMALGIFLVCCRLVCPDPLSESERRPVLHDHGGVYRLSPVCHRSLLPGFTFIFLLCLISSTLEFKFFTLAFIIDWFGTFYPPRRPQKPEARSSKASPKNGRNTKAGKAGSSWRAHEKVSSLSKKSKA